MYPASSEWVTSVGATQLLANTNASGGCYVSEVVCSVFTGAIITAGGGFSRRIRTSSSWQRDAVNGYVNSKAAPSAGFDRTMRGYPDISVAILPTETCSDSPSASLCVLRF